MTQSDHLSEAFKRDGVVVLPRLFDSGNIGILTDALTYSRLNPSPMAREVKDDGGNTTFFTDFFTYKKNPHIRSILQERNFINLIRQVSGATELRLFHDHVLIKTGDAPETPWHQDRPYYLVDGPISFSVWITPDQVPLSESLAFIRGSHALGREFAPVNFNNGEIIDQDNNNFEHLNIKEIEELAQLGVLTFSLSPGDGLMFDNRIIHKAMRGNDEANRRALSIRFVGDGAFMTARVINPTPPFHRMGLRIQEGKPVTDVWFPRVELI